MRSHYLGRSLVLTLRRQWNVWNTWILIFLTIIVLFISVFLGILAFAVVAGNAQKQLGQKCSATTLWTDIYDLPNPNQYYDCVNNKTIVGTCVEGRGFAIEENTNGCIPYKNWPCLKNNGGYPGTQNCRTSPITPWPAEDPNQYYICVTDVNGKQQASRALNCNGIYGSSGFYRNDTITTIGEEALGCLDWVKWRQMTGCNKF